MLLIRNTTVVVLDDDKSVQYTWDSRFKSAGEGAKTVSLLKFSRADEVLAWKKSGKAPNDVLYLCDYQLNHQTRNGLDVIEELAIQDRAVLVTGHFEEREIRERCMAQGVRLVPKELIGFLPIHVSPVAAI